MREFRRLVSLAAISVLPLSSGFSSDQTPEKLTVVLEGQGVNEVAPHGAGNVYAPDVMWDGLIFKMWYGGQGKDGHDRISYAESLDGATRDRQGVVLTDDAVNHLNDLPHQSATTDDAVVGQNTAWDVSFEAGLRVIS